MAPPNDPPTAPPPATPANRQVRCPSPERDRHSDSPLVRPAPAAEREVTNSQSVRPITGTEQEITDSQLVRPVTGTEREISPPTNIPLVRPSTSSRPDRGLSIPLVRPPTSSRPDRGFPPPPRPAHPFTAWLRKTPPTKPHSMVTTVRERPTKETDEQSRESATANQDETSATQSEERTVANVERAKRRNRARFETADTADHSTLGEWREKGEGSVRNREGDRAEGIRHHLDARASTYFNKAIEGQDDAFVPPDWFLEAVRVIAETEPPVPAGAPLTFENSDEAAERNEVVLRAVGYDLEKLISENLGITLGYGSEFRPIKQLKSLIGSHPHFAELSRVLKFGMSYVFLKELDALTKLSELRVLLKRGNHKSA